MELFDIVKKIFTQNKSEWDKVSKNDKNRNFFMLNRIMGIQFPVQANQFNKLKVNPSPVIDWWNDSLSHRYSKTPSWIFTKTNKKESSKKLSSINDGETEKFIMQSLSISSRDLDLIKRFYPERYAKWIDDVRDQIGLKK
jgi:hypothetical protein